MTQCFCPNISEEEFLALDFQEHDWTGKTFYRVKVPMISHFPVAPELKIPKVVTEMGKKGLELADPSLIIFNDGMFLGSLLIEVVTPKTKHPDLKKLGSVRVFSRAYKGPRHLVPKALKEFDHNLMKRDIVATDYYFWFLSCKNCQKSNKDNRTIIFAQANS